MAELNPGDKAPNFTSQNQKGEKVSLSDYKGKKVVLYFYPEDDTPGCTAEACNLRDNLGQLKAQGYEVLGVSPDSVSSHEQFAQKFSLPFTLIADPDKKIVNQYGVWGEKNLYGKKVIGLKRTTFLINEEGTIERIIRRVDTQNHTAQILK